MAYLVVSSHEIESISDGHWVCMYGLAGGGYHMLD